MIHYTPAVDKQFPSVSSCTLSGPWSGRVADLVLFLVWNAFTLENIALSQSLMGSIFTSGESLPPCVATCSFYPLCQCMFHGHDGTRPPVISMCVCLAVFSPWENRQTAGVSVKSVVSCALHTSGMNSPFIKRELLWTGQNCEKIKRRKGSDGCWGHFSMNGLKQNKTKNVI